MAPLKLHSFRELCESIGLRGDKRDERDAVPLLSNTSSKPSLEARPGRFGCDKRKMTVFGLRTLETCSKIYKDHGPKHKCDICERMFTRPLDRVRGLGVS
jgi:hypothetical protein